VEWSSRGLGLLDLLNLLNLLNLPSLLDLPSPRDVLDLPNPPDLPTLFRPNPIPPQPRRNVSTRTSPTRPTQLRDALSARRPAPDAVLLTDRQREACALLAHRARVAQCPRAPLALAACLPALAGGREEA
jgi:hypothetical protein